MIVRGTTDERGVFPPISFISVCLIMQAKWSSCWICLRFQLVIWLNTSVPGSLSSLDKPYYQRPPAEALRKDPGLCPPQAYAHPRPVPDRIRLFYRRCHQGGSGGEQRLALPWLLSKTHAQLFPFWGRKKNTKLPFYHIKIAIACYHKTQNSIKW